MYIPPILFVSFFLASLFVFNNQSSESISKSTSLNKQIDSTPTPKIRTIKVHNYLTPMPLSELGDSVLMHFIPSLEGSIIATKEFKERYDMMVRIAGATYPNDKKANGQNHARQYLVPLYLELKYQNMYQIDSAVCAYFLESNISEPNSYDYDFGLALLKISKNRKTSLAQRDSLKDDILSKYICHFCCSDIYSNFLTHSWQGRFAQYGHPKLKSSCKCKQNLQMSNHRIVVKVSNKNIKQLEPYIISYCPRDSHFFYLPQEVSNYKNNGVRFYNPPQQVKDGIDIPIYSYMLSGCLPSKYPHYFLAMAESTDGQMLAGIRPFMVSDTTHYEMELQPMKWEDFNAAVNALK